MYFFVSVCPFVASARSRKIRHGAPSEESEKGNVFTESDFFWGGVVSVEFIVFGKRRSSMLQSKHEIKNFSIALI